MGRGQRRVDLAGQSHADGKWRRRGDRCGPAAATIGATTLAANAASGITLSGANTVQTVVLTNTTSGNISYTNSTVGALNTLTVSGSNTGGSFSATETSGSLAVPLAGISTKGGAVNLTTQKALGMLTLTGNVDTTTGGATTGGSVVLRGDVLLLIGTVNAGTTGNVQLRPNDLLAAIGLLDAVPVFNLTNALLNQITISGGTLTIGDVTHQGTISVSPIIALAQGRKNIALVNQGAATANIVIAGLADFTANNLTLSAGGAITADLGHRQIKRARKSDADSDEWYWRHCRCADSDWSCRRQPRRHECHEWRPFPENRDHFLGRRRHQSECEPRRLARGCHRDCRE